MLGWGDSNNLKYAWLLTITDVNMNSSGSAAFDKDDGSTEPEKKHRIDTVHHQTGKIIRKAHPSLHC